MEISNRTQRWGGALGLLAMVAVLSIGVYLTAIQGDQFAALAAMLLVVAAFPWYLSLRAGRFELFEPIVFYSIFFGMLVFGWIERVYVDEPEFYYDFISRTFTEGFLLVGSVMLILFISIMLGYYLFGPIVARRFSHIGRKTRSILETASQPSGNVFRTIGGLYMLIGLGSIIATVVLVFPVNEILYLYTTNEPRSQIFPENGVFILFSRTLYIGYLLWLCGAVVDGRTPSLIEFALAIPFTGAILLLGGRSRALSIIIIAVIFLYYTVIEDVFSLDRGGFAKLTDYVPPGILLLCIPIIGLVMSIGVIILRGMRLGQSLVESFTSVDLFSILTAGRHADTYDNFLGLMEFVPEQVDYYYGSFYARVPLNFIPRSIWPEKPVLTSGGFFRRLAFPDQTGGRPPGAMGEYYLNFGLPGIPLMGTLYGVLMYLTWRLIKNDRVSVISLVVFTLLLDTIGQGGLNNNTLFVLASNVILLIPVLLLLSGWQYFSSPIFQYRRHNDS